MLKKFRKYSLLLCSAIILNVCAVSPYAASENMPIFSLDLSKADEAEENYGISYTMPDGSAVISCNYINKIDSFESKNGKIMPYIELEADSNSSALAVTFDEPICVYDNETYADKAGDISIDFWMKVPGKATTGIYARYFSFYDTANKEVFEMENNKMDEHGRLSVQPSSFAGCYIGASNQNGNKEKGCLDSFDKWVHFVITQSVQKNSDSEGKADYTNKLYANGVYIGERTASAKDWFSGLKTLYLCKNVRTASQNDGKQKFSLASFNIYNSILTDEDVEKIYNNEKDNYDEKNVTILSHNENDRVCYPVQLNGKTSKTDTQELKISVGNGEWKDVAVSNGKWEYSLKEGEYGKIPVKLCVFDEDGNDEYTEELTLEFTKELVLSDAKITGRTPVSGTVKTERVSDEISSYKIIAALFEGAKMIEYVEAEEESGNEYGFKFGEHDEKNNLHIKLFALDSLDNGELVSNSVLLPENAEENIEEAESIAPYEDAVNITATQYSGENSFKISMLASKKYKNDALVIIKTPEGNIDYINTVPVDENGSAAFRYDINNIIVDKDYTIYAGVSGVFGKGTMKCFSYQTISDTLDAIKNTSKENFEENILNDAVYAEVLSLDMSYYDFLDSERKGIVLDEAAGKEYSSIGEFKSKFVNVSFVQNVLLTLQNTNGSEYGKKLEEKARETGTKLDGIYTLFNDSEKEKLFNEINKEKYYSYINLNTAIENKLAAALIDNKTPEDFVSGKYIEKYYSELGIEKEDKELYEALKNKNKIKVIDRIKLAEIFDKATAKSAFSESVAYISDPNNDVYMPIMKADLSKADETSTDISKGITLSKGDGMSVTAASVGSVGKYQTKDGGRVKYVELNGESQKISINMGSPEIREATVEFWTNIDSSIIRNNNNKRLNIFDVSAGTNNKLLHSACWVHPVTNLPCIPINGYFAEKYGDSDSYFDSWNHYVFTYGWDDEGKNIEYAFYINGKRVNGDGNARNIPTLTQDIVLTVGTGAKLKISDISYYNEMLTEKAVSKIYNDELPAHDPAAINLNNYDNGDVAVYPFELKGTVIKEGNQTFEISEDKKVYKPVDVSGSDWKYNFESGELGVRTVYFRIVNSDSSVREEIAVPITFGYPLEIINRTDSSVTLRNRHTGSKSLPLSAEVAGVVYENGKVKEIQTRSLSMPIDNGQEAILDFAFDSFDENSYIKYIAVDSIEDLNMIAGSAFYPQSASEKNPQPGDISVIGDGVFADVFAQPDTWKTLISAATTKKCKNVLITVYDKDNKLVYMGEATPGEDGKCAVEYIADNPYIDENYILNVKAGEYKYSTIFRYNTSENISKALLAVKNSAVSNFETEIIGNDSYRYALLIDKNVFDTLSQNYKYNVIEKVAGKTFSDVESFKNEFTGAINEQMILQELYNSNVENAEEIILKYKNELGINTADGYDIVSETFKKDILANAVCKKYYKTITEARTSFFENSMLSLFNYKQKLEILNEDLFANYAEKFNLAASDVRTYSGYSRDNKLKVIEKMKLAGINSYEQLYSVFASSLKISETDSGTKGSTGGGGGGNSGYTAPTTVSIPDVIDEEYAQAVAGSIFRDLRTDHWAYTSVKNLVDLGVINGVGDGKFDADGKVTREQFLKMIIEALDIQIDESAESKFVDADRNEWYYKYVSTAEKLGIVNGVSDDSFGIGTNINRAQMCTIVCRAVDYSFKKISEVREEKHFADMDAIPGYALDYVIKLDKAGVINGFEDMTFRPDETATRAMAAKIIDGLLENFK